MEHPFEDGYNDYLEAQKLKGMSDNQNIFPKREPSYRKPDYYRRTIKGVEVDVYDIAYAYGLPPCLMNALKYILRAGHKQNESVIKDLDKACESIEREKGFYEANQAQ